MNIKILKENTVLIGLSLLFLLIPSLLIAWGLSYFFQHFWVLLIISIGCVFIIGQISNMWVRKKADMDILRIKNHLTEIATQQSVEVSCSYCKDRNLVPVRLNTRNTFECKKCNQTNLIIFQFATAQITVPLENPQLGTVLPPQAKKE